jgi:hypothetical protein
MGTFETTKRSGAQFATSMADLGSVSRFYFDSCNPELSCFVSDKTLELEKAPVAYPVVHTLTSSLLPYTFEVFHHDLVAYEVGNNALAYIVVNPSHKPLLPARYLHQKTFGRPCAFSLENRTQMLKPSLSLLDLRGMEELAVRSDSQIIYSEINAKNLTLRVQVSNINLFGEREAEEASLLLIDKELAFLHLPVSEVSSIALWNIDLDMQSLIANASNTQSVVNVSCAAWEIVADGYSTNDWFGLSLFNDATCIPDAGNSQLGM